MAEKPDAGVRRLGGKIAVLKPKARRKVDEQSDKSELGGNTEMYYHASPVNHIVELEPRISNHGIPLVYFSRKRENVLVYLSNAVEKYCKDMGFPHNAKWYKWAPYGFDKDGRQRITEYYPDALKRTYEGVSGYIYSAEKIIDSGFQHQIPDAVTSSQPVKVTGIEFVPDAYEAILQAEHENLITITRYYELSDKRKNWRKDTIRQEYEDASGCPDYRYFLQGVFPDILSEYHCS